MNITEYAIKNDRVTLMLLFIILVSGISVYLDMPRAEDPGFTIRNAQIVAYLPGASPQRVESLVTDKLEKVIQEMPEVKNIISESRTGVSMVFVNVKPEYTDMRPIWDKLRRKVQDATDQLPQGSIGPIVNDEFGDVFGIIMTLTGDGYSYAELKKIADEVRDEILQLDEAAKVDIYGAQEERVFVEYNNARLAELGLSPQQLVPILEAQNIINPGGSVTVGDERIVLEPTGNFESLEDLKKTLISLPNAKDLLALGDVVNVYRGYVDPPIAKVTSSGQESLGLAISLREGGNIIRLGEEMHALSARLKATYPIGINFDFVTFQPAEVERKVDLFMRNLVEAIVIVAGMMFLSLGFSTGLIVSTLVPSCILMAILFMNFFNIGLDQVSLAALIIALGMLVDNGIVMVDMISVHVRGGKPVKQAAIEAANELRVPLLSGTLITCAAFLPIFLAESETGEYTAPLFTVVTITLLSSWVLALTLTPLLCTYFLKVGDKSTAENYNSPMYQNYRRLLLACLKAPWKTVGGMMLAFFLALIGFNFIPQAFFPPTDRPYFTAEIELPTGSTIEKTEHVVTTFERFITQTLKVDAKDRDKGLAWLEIAEDEDRMEDSLLQDKEEGIKNWVSFIGQSAPRFHIAYDPKIESPEYAFLILNVSNQLIIDDLVAVLETFMAREYPEARVRVARTEYGPPVDHPIAIRVVGRDLKTLFGYVDAVKSKIISIPGTKNVYDNWGVRTKKILVKINQPRARRAGVTNADIATSLQASLSGIEISQFREGSDVIPITLRTVASDRQDLSKLDTLNVFSEVTGRSVSLKQVADVEIVWEPARVLRRDLLKSVTVFADLKPGMSADEVNDELLPWLDEDSKKWQPGYRPQLGGEFESADEANQSIMAKLPLGAFIIILLLVMEFNSMRRTLIHLSTVIMGLIGVVVGLLLTGSYFGFMTLLGVIALAGVEVGHAIVLLDRIHTEMTVYQRAPADAIIAASQSRFRPIYLTAATAAGGLVPLWISGGAMWEPMAIVLIFGLTFATILTLGVLPVLYSLFYRVSFKSYEYPKNGYEYKF